MAAEADRLSDLCDDILTHILSFLPSGEAARTTALSRRWRRPLWHHAGAVHIDYRSYSSSTTGGGVPDRQLLVDHADDAFDSLFSSRRFPKKLSIVMPHDAMVCEAVDTDDEQDDDDCSECLSNGCLPCCTPPFAAIRHLELTGYDLKPYTDRRRRRLAFPRLEAMRLRRCHTELGTLQGIISAAPRLADISLESLTFEDDEYVYRLSCEAATSLVMANCVVLHDRHDFPGSEVQIDAPRLRRFRYAHGIARRDITSFSFARPTPPDLEHVHLEVHSNSWLTIPYPRRNILAGVSYVRSLKLTAYSIADLDIEELPDFHNIERLEIEELCGWSDMNHGSMAKAVVNLLRRCPSLVELRVKFSWRKYLREINADPADEMAAIADFSPCGSVDGDGDATNCCDALDGIHKQFCGGSMIRGLRLRRVVVEFDADELTCFQVQLIKFLATTATDLQELVVNGGREGYDSSHINRKVASWMQWYRASRERRYDYWSKTSSQTSISNVKGY